jgi:hypothetical protein
MAFLLPSALDFWLDVSITAGMRPSTDIQSIELSACSVVAPRVAR